MTAGDLDWMKGVELLRLCRWRRVSKSKRPGWRCNPCGAQCVQNTAPDHCPSADLLADKPQPTERLL